VNWRDLFFQFASYWTWVVIWYLFTYVGNDPIHVSNAPQVNNETARVASDTLEYGQANEIIYLLLFGFVVVHQTMCIQLAHVTRQRYRPWTRILVGAQITLVSFAAISYFRK
jgi:hypothetical protein